MAHKRNKVVVGVCLISLLAFQSLSPSQIARAGEDTAPEPVESASLSVFGVNMHRIKEENGLRLMTAADVDWVRIPPLFWSDVEPTEGARNWNAPSIVHLEQDLLKAAANNLKVVLIVMSTPAWAQKTPGYSCGAVKPSKLYAFASFMRDAVARYSKGLYRVEYWEIGNEPDVAPELVETDSGWGCWGDSTGEIIGGVNYYGGNYYAEMLTHVYPAVKSANPKVKVIVGGLLMDCDPAVCAEKKPPANFFEGILYHYGKKDGGQYFDGVSFHAYEWYGARLGRYTNPHWRTSSNTTGPSVIAKARYLKSRLEEYGFTDKLLLDTEAAVLCICDYTVENYELTKSYYVAQSYAAGIAEGLHSMYWFSVEGWWQSGLLNPSYPHAYNALKFARSRLGDVKFVRPITDYRGIKGYEFERGDAKLWLLWSLDGRARRIKLPSTPSAAWGVEGDQVKIAGYAPVKLEPLYLEFREPDFRKPHFRQPTFREFEFRFRALEFPE
jgi:hypothetical protein